MTTPTTLPPGHVHLWHAVLPSPASSREPALRAILAHYLRWPADVLPIDATTHSLAGLHFSTTVSARHALIAIAREPAIGIDLEFIRHDIPVDELAAGYFDPRDEWEIRTARGDQRAVRFFQLWTCREARLKAAGPCVVRSIDAPPGCAAAIALPLDSHLVCWDMAA